MKERPILFKGPLVRAILDGTKTQTRRLSKDQNPVDAGASMHGVHLRNVEVIDGRRVVGVRKVPVHCPYGEPGDRLWVRETFAKCLAVSPVDGQPMPVTNGDRLIEEPTFWVDEKGNKHWRYDGLVICYRATSDVEFVDGDGFHADAGGNKDDMPTWKPSIHMRREFSRIDLEITEVRVQRLQDITEEDARAEGMLYHDGHGIGHSGWRHDVNYGCVQGTAQEAFAVAWDIINGAKASWASNPWVWAITFKRIRP